jgi:uncharacterized protein YuzE
MPIDVTYDPVADAVSIVFAEGSSEGEEVRPGVILHFDAEDRIVEIEILSVSKILPPGAVDALSSKSPVFYEPTTDTMAIELRPWPGGEGAGAGGEDAGSDLVIHYAPDGEPWLWEIENASQHPEHIVAALMAMRRARPSPSLDF